MSLYSNRTFCVLTAILFSLLATYLICCSTLKIGLTGIVVVFGILPLIFRCSRSVQNFFIFLNYIQWPRSYELLHPERLGLLGARNLYIRTHSKVTNKGLVLGIWHALPTMYKNWSSYAELSMPAFGEGIQDEDSEGDGDSSVKNGIFDSLLARSGRPIIIYAHGNSNNRGCHHRVGLYKLLQDLQYHVVVFDYRSYGDSTKMALNELGVVEDTIMVYKWVLKKMGDMAEEDMPPIYFWGHSLGTGITCHALSLLASEGSDSGIEMPTLKLEPRGLILESPFNNFHDELTQHFFGKMFSLIPWFQWSIVDPVIDNGIEFESDRHITIFRCPVLILHAVDDRVVPYKLGVKLYETALADRPKGFGEVKMVTFLSKDRLGHKNIYKANGLADIIGEFVSRNYKPSSDLSTTTVEDS